MVLPSLGSNLVLAMFTEEFPWPKGRDPLERVMGGAVVDWLGWKYLAAA